MSKYTHTLKFKEKGKYRNLKHGFIEHLYRNNMAYAIEKQITDKQDMLILFETKFGDKFHMRMADCYFVRDKDELQLNPMLYLSKTVDTNDIDMEFMKYISLIRHSYLVNTIFEITNL